MDSFATIAIAAAELAAAAQQIAIQQKAIYNTGTSPPTQAQINGDLWETFRVFYAGLISASSDPADWPNPMRVNPKPSAAAATTTKLPAAPSSN